MKIGLTWTPRNTGGRIAKEKINLHTKILPGGIYCTTPAVIRDIGCSCCDTGPLFFSGLIRKAASFDTQWDVADIF
jgi:hypothetical protein